MSSYNPIQLAQDATKFAESPFGIHYLERLETTKQQSLLEAMSSARKGLRDAEHAALLQASFCNDQIDYFRTAKQIKNDPNLIDRLRIAVQKRTKKDKEDAEEQQ